MPFMTTFGSAALVVLLSAGGPAAAGEDAAALRERATAEYRKKRWAEACALFERAARAAPQDAAIQADVGLCLLKLGKKGASALASHRATALSAANELFSKEALEVRRGAYHNLRLAGAALPLPAPGTCAELRAAPGCAKALHACTFRWRREGMRIAERGDAVRISRTAEGARVADTTRAEGDAVRDAEAPEVHVDVAESGPADFDMLLRREQDADADPDLDRRMAYHRWRDRSDPCDVALASEDELVSTGGHDWSNFEPDRTECVVVEANACTGHVGSVCTRAGGARTARDVLECRLPVGE